MLTRSSCQLDRKQLDLLRSCATAATRLFLATYDADKQDQILHRWRDGDSFPARVAVDVLSERDNPLIAIDHHMVTECSVCSDSDRLSSAMEDFFDDLLQLAQWLDLRRFVIKSWCDGLYDADAFRDFETQAKQDLSYWQSEHRRMQIMQNNGIHTEIMYDVTPEKAEQLIKEGDFTRLTDMMTLDGYRSGGPIYGVKVPLYQAVYYVETKIEALRTWLSVVYACMLMQIGDPTKRKRSAHEQTSDDAPWVSDLLHNIDQVS